MIVALSSFHHGIRLLTSIISAEVIAKYIMVIQAHKGISAWSGFSSPFTVAMKDRRKMIIASIISILAILFFGSGYFGIIALIISLAVAAIIQFVSNESFGGISGDVMGASNEITRLSSLVVLSGIMP
jgi:adenosylcobinamide-GDP ribazoletransferase